MNRTLTRSTIFALLLLALCSPLHSQSIWPGDINNNGRVNGVDWLYWGLGNQQTGPVRPGASLSWEAQPMGSPWGNQFPTGNNYAYADVDGNGVINMSDAQGIATNFGLSHGLGVPDNYPTAAANAPAITLERGEPTAMPEEIAKVGFALGSADRPLENLYGLTFVLEYPPKALLNEGLYFATEQGLFMGQDGNAPRVFIRNDSLAGRAEITITRTNQVPESGYGEVGKFFLRFSDLSSPTLPDTLTFAITKVMAIDAQMNTIPLQKSSMFFLLGDGNSGNNPILGPCPPTVAPVCGSNGVTYLNSCYAEAAGIFDYTPGTCFGPCVDPGLINAAAVCPAIYDPVCGCNGITYANECEAEAAGVTSTSPGPCAASSCYDPQYVLSSAATTLDPVTGIITADIPSTYDPVCGCNGVTYNNAYQAQASGITSYTPGTCESACIDATAINPDATCLSSYNPVCGCNEVTYANACRAEAAGVTSYTSGPCGGNSPWCATAIPIYCGDFLAAETTIGAGNNLLSYPGCSNTLFQGPDRIYMLNKTTAGDLQIGLEILTPGLDLDLFLLADNCSQVTCLRSSTTSNSSTNNEGILLPDAPIGTYYIVVDGQYASSAGNFRLEVSCGYLYCGDAVALSCGQPYSGSNANGSDDVSLYGCDGNIYNVENNGPEVVHTFTTTEAGPVTINLTGLTANLELFLLRSCDRGDCMDYSQQPGSSNESITAFLPPGTYYVVVDGYNGAVSNYTLEVNCNTSCNFTLAALNSTPSSCLQNTGSITISTSGGQPNYLIQYSGPISGAFTTSYNTCTISNLPPGTYTLTKTDAMGCSVSGTVVIQSLGSLNVILTPQDVVCMDAGSIGVHITNGTPPYHIQLTGPVNGSATVNSSLFNLNDLEAGNYTVFITDGSLCSFTQQVTIEHTSGNFHWTGTATPANCGQLGSIHVVTSGGVPPYAIFVEGPISGSANTNAGVFNINNLPGGVYHVTIEDGNWCVEEQTIIVPDQQMTIDLTAQPGICGQNGAITVHISNGTPQYHISWSGPISGSANTNNANYTLPNLPSGSYTFTVTDQAGCVDHQTITINNTGGNLSFSLMSIDGGCNQNGAIWIDIYNGSPNYTITWTGPQNGTLVTDDTSLDIPNVPPGTYTVTITDGNGCSGTQTVVISTGSNLGISLTPQTGDCGQSGSLLVNISGGSPTYLVSWTGPQSGTTTTNVNSVDLTGLVPGIYTVTVTDSEGCQSSATAQITSSGGNLTLQTFLTHATCGSTGAIGLEVFGGTAPYQVSWTGPIGGALTSNDQWIDITGLPAGTYHIYVTDANGCTAEATVTILNQGSNLTISLVGNDAICDLYGNIGVYVTNGTAPYTISWSGPIAGATTTNSAVYQIQNTPAGTYNVVVTDANGCTTSGTVTVVAVNQLQATLTPTNGECGDNGILTLNITAGTGPFQVIWSGPTSGSVTTPNTLFTLNDLPSGTYTVVVTDSHGCTRSFTRTINNTDGGIDLQASLIYNECGQYNTIWVDVFGGTPPYTITWQGPQNGGVTVPTGEYEIMDLPPGTYKVIVVDANGCMDMQSGIIVYPAPITLFTATPNNGICGEDGSIVIDILDGTPNYTLTWTGPINGSAVLTGGQYTMAGLPSGTYTLTLVDANGCAQTQTVVINNTVSNVEIVASLIYNECGQYNTIWVDIFGGTPPYTITWTGTQNGSVTVPTGEYEIMDLPPGTYKVTVVDANGCMDMQQGIIIYPAPIDLFTATPFNGICGENGSIVVDILAGTPPYVLSWSGPVSGSMGMNSGPYTIGNLPSGTYTIILTDANGCAETETVVINNAPGGSVDVQVSLIYNECGQYNTLWVDIFGGTPPYVITWTGTQNGSVTTNTGAYEIMDLPPGTYKVTVVDANGCMDMQQDLIIYPAPIDLFTATPVSGFCSGPGAINVDIFGGTPDYTLSWSGPMSGSVVVSGPAYSITGLVTGTYTISLVDMNGCAETEVVTVTSTEGDIAITPTANTGTCVSNPSIMIEVDGGEPGYTINWSGPESGSATFDGSMYIIPDLLPGQYTVQVTDSQGCDDQANVNVTQAEDDLGISVTANPGDCGSNGSLDVLISGGQSPYLVSWSGPSSGDQVAMGSSLNIPNLPDGVYTVSVMDTNGCTDELVITLASPEDDLVVSLTPLNGVCGQPGSINVFYSGGSAPYTVTWMGPSPGSVTIPGNSVNLPNLPAGTYTVTVSSGDCSDTAMTTLTNNTDNLSVSLTPNNGDCGNLGSLGVNISGGFAPYTISWNGPSMGSTTTDGTFLNIPNLASGAYEVTVMSGTCTESATASISNIPDNLSVSAIGTNGECGGLGTIVVNIMGGAPPYMVTWSGPIDSGTLTDDNTVVIPDLPDGTYSIFVLNGSCSDVAQVTISNSPNGLFITATPNNGICDAPGSIDLTFGGGIPPYTINWSGPSSGSTTANGNTFTVPNLPSGTYTFTVLNGGCSRSNTATLNNTPNSLFLNATPTAGNCGSDGSITLSFGGGSSPYTISWSGAENGSVTTTGPTYTIPSLSSGTYNITLSSGGCTTTTTTTLDNGQQASISITATALPEPCGVYGDILVNISGGTAPYTLHWAGPVTGSSTVNGSAFTIQDLPGGTYTLTVFDDNNCGNSTFIYLPASTLNLFVSAANGTCGDNGFLDIYFANGQAPYTLTWTGPVSGSISPSPTTYIVPNLPSGAYTVTVEDANGCTDTETVTITNTEGDFYVVHMVGSNGCGQYSNIWMDFYEGEAPYTINWSGPVSGTASTNQNFYDIVNVPSGVYTITVIDGLGCVDVQTVTVVNIANDLEVTFSPANGSCGGPGKIGVTTEGGTPPYQVSWQGSSSSGSVTTNLTYYVINNLPAGSYNVWLTDANGCEVNAIVQVSTPFSGMQVQNTVVPPGCSGLGAVGLIMGSSQPPYDISWEGQQTGSAVSNVGNYMLTGLAPGEYLILITDANGCVGFAEITMPGGPAGTITADFTATVDEMTIDFDNHSNAGSYLWTFGDGSQSTSTHPTHTYTQPGTYEVCLTVSAACGSDTYCQFFTVMPAADVALLDVGDGAAGPGGTVNVPVTIQHLDNLISLTGSLALANPSVAEVIGLTPGLINPQFNAGNLSFSFFNSGGAPLAVTDGQVLFYVQVTLTGQVGESSLLSLVNAPLPVTISSMVSGSPTAIAHNELPGTVSVTNMGQLAGLINTYWGGPIANAEVHLSGGGYDEFIMTDENGYYELPPATLGTDYTVDPFKDTDPTNGLSTYALFVGQRFLLGMEPAQITSPYQVIAGDANCNDAFTTLDLFLIQQLILGTNDEFSNCPSWVFVAEGQDMPAAFDAYNVFPYISAPSFMLMHDTTANFVGVKVGDILGQAEPGNRPGGGLPAEPRNGEELIFRAPNASVSAGQEVTLYFNSPNFEEVVSYQFGLLFDPAQMEFLGFEPSSVEPFQTVAVGNNDAAEGKLRLSWFSLDGFGHSANPATTLFGLRFRALTPISDWGEILRISPVDMLPEAYNQAEQPLEPVLEFVNTTATWEANGLSFALEQNVPNPFRHETVIGFTLPEASETVFTVHDALGRKVWEQQRHYGAGHQMIRLDEQVLTPGVYHYTLRAGGQTASRSMVVLE